VSKKSFNNAPTKEGLSPAMVESGTIVNVNVKNLTVDWVSQFSGKQITDLKIMTPYLHYNNGEGFTCIPEVGALCEVCFPSDEDAPFIMGFVSAPEVEGGSSKDVQEEVKDPGVESEEDLSEAVSTGSTGATTTGQTTSDASFRAGRPILNPGDMLWQGRDGNFVIIKRGGVLQIGATQVCQRAYIPLLNYIRDFCENYELNTAAGSISWTVQRQENDPTGNAPTEYTLLAREFAQDAKASIKVSIGCLADAPKPPGAVQDKPYVEIVIAPQSIDPKDGTVTSGIKYVLRLDRAGNSYVMQAGTRTDEIKGNHVVTVTGDQTVNVGGKRHAEITGNDELVVDGEHQLTGKKGSSEKWSTIKSITATAIKLGSEGASEPVPKGLALAVWLASHTHPASYTPPIQAPTLANVLSKKVFVE